MFKCQYMRGHHLTFGEFMSFRMSVSCIFWRLAWVHILLSCFQLAVTSATSSSSQDLLVVIIMLQNMHMIVNVFIMRLNVLKNKLLLQVSEMGLLYLPRTSATVSEAFISCFCCIFLLEDWSDDLSFFCLFVCSGDSSCSKRSVFGVKANTLREAIVSSTKTHCAVFPSTVKLTCSCSCFHSQLLHFRSHWPLTKSS